MTVYPERAEVHILDDEAAARAYIEQMWAEAMTVYRRIEPHDELQGESGSICIQRMMLGQYAAEHGLTVVDEYGRRMERDKFRAAQASKG